MFSLYDCVKLIEPVDGEPVSTDDVGVIIIVFESPRLAYELEFSGEDGVPFAQFAVEPHQIRKHADTAA